MTITTHTATCPNPTCGSDLKSFRAEVDDNDTRCADPWHDTPWPADATRDKISTVLNEHQVVGVSGYGVEQIMCDCSRYVWYSTDQYREHLALKLAAALAEA
jgi:hypothetical protein